jgi:hypothetical protein
MTKLRPHSLFELLETGALADLATEARRRQGLTARIRALLPADEAAHLVVASLTESGELLLMMDSSAWAARVRYRADELGTERLRVRVLPQTDQSDSPGTS